MSKTTDERYVLFEWTCSCSTEIRVHGKFSPGFSSGAMTNASCPRCGTEKSLPTTVLRMFYKNNSEWLPVNVDMIGRDTQWRLQSARIQELVREMVPRADIIFDRDSVPDMIRFFVKFNGVVLIPSSGHLDVDDLAMKSDEQLRLLIKSLSGGRI